jgi:hypothetical protein
MSSVPEKYICDIKDCGKEVPTTSSGKRDYVQVHYALTSEFTGDRLYTRKEPVLDEAELDLCPEHWKQFVEQLPIRGKHDRTQVIYTMKEQN